MNGSIQDDRAEGRPAAKPFRLGMLVHDVSRIRRTVMDQALRPFSLTRSQWMVLNNLSRNNSNGMMQAELARLLEIGKVTIGGLVDRLEMAGLVERRADRGDRRLKRVFITDRGYAVLQEIIVIAGEMNGRILAGIGEDEQRLCESVLAKLKVNLKEMLAETGQQAGMDEEAGPG